MSLEGLLGDIVMIETLNKTVFGPAKASVQRNKVYIHDTSVEVQEGGKIVSVR